jgi:hypothetical protein
MVLEHVLKANQTPSEGSIQLYALQRKETKRVLTCPCVYSPLACRNVKQLTKFHETSAGNHKICDSEFPTIINTNMAAVGV